MAAEPRPLSEPANATMQISSGAGLGTPTTRRSTRMAMSAVAAARAGPEMSRQSNCIPSSLPDRTDRGINEEVSNPLIKKRLNGPVGLCDLLDQMQSDWNCPVWKGSQI